MIFSVGDYELNNTAYFSSLINGHNGHRYFFPNSHKIIEREITPPAASETFTTNGGRPVAATVLDDPWLSNSSPKVAPNVPKPPTQIVDVTAKPVVNGSTVSKGVRKGHIRNVGGKAVMVGQSILKAGKNTAGSLAAVTKANPRLAIATGVGGAALGAGGAFLATRRKRKRR